MRRHQTLFMLNLTTRPGDQNGRRASGFTLFEVLLVLIIIVIMGSLAAPLLQNSISTFRLRSSTDTIIAAWSEIRARAIETGHVYQFRFMEYEDRYRVERWYTENQTPEHDTDEESTEELLQDEEDNWHYEETLPEGVIFRGGEQTVVDQEGEKKLEHLEENEGDSWSIPILFFPDGTTSNASIILRNDNHQYQRTTLRSLTGVARASQLLSETDVEEASEP